MTSQGTDRVNPADGVWFLQTSKRTPQGLRMFMICTGMDVQGDGVAMLFHEPVLGEPASLQLRNLADKQLISCRKWMVQLAKTRAGETQVGETPSRVVRRRRQRAATQQPPYPFSIAFSHLPGEIRSFRRPSFAPPSDLPWALGAVVQILPTVWPAWQAWGLTHDIPAFQGSTIIYENDNGVDA